jgi:hypothetical protein
MAIGEKPEDHDEALAEFYGLWQALKPNEPLPYERALEGFTRYLVSRIRWSWDDQTPIKEPFYLIRDDALKVWCRDAATNRLAVRLRPAYTWAQFQELIFSEQMRRGGKKAMADPRWTPLFQHMQLTHNVQFFSHLRYLFNQRTPRLEIWPNGCSACSGTGQVFR